MEKVWPAKKFTEKFEEVLFNHLPVKKINPGSSIYELPLKTKNLSDTIERKVKKYKRKFKKLNIKSFLTAKKADEII